MVDRQRDIVSVRLSFMTLMSSTEISFALPLISWLYVHQRQVLVSTVMRHTKARTRRPPYVPPLPRARGRAPSCRSLWRWPRRCTRTCWRTGWPGSPDRRPLVHNQEQTTVIASVFWSGIRRVQNTTWSAIGRDSVTRGYPAGSGGWAGHECALEATHERI